MALTQGDWRPCTRRSGRRQRDDHGRTGGGQGIALGETPQRAGPNGNGPQDLGPCMGETTGPSGQIIPSRGSECEEAKWMDGHLQCSEATPVGAVLSWSLQTSPLPRSARLAPGPPAAAGLWPERVSIAPSPGHLSSCVCPLVLPSSRSPSSLQISSSGADPRVEMWEQCVVI